MKPIRFHPEAETEMVEAARFYETQQPALGRRFLESVQEAAARVQSNPLVFREVECDVRRCLVRTFP